MSGWRDISTAPRDGTVFLAAEKHDGHWYKNECWWDGSSGQWFSNLCPPILHPTHWQPWPEDPA